jgi:ATP-binding cassette, subfamily C, bacterial exporter for protease/lipase
MKPLIKSPQGELFDALLKFKSAFKSVGFFSFIINMLMLVPAIYMLQVYDRALPSRNEITLLMLTVIMLGLFALMAALEYVRSLVIIRVGAQLDLELNNRIYTAAFEQNLKKAGVNAGQALGDLTTIRQFVTGNGLFAFFDAPWFPIYLAVIFFFNPWLGLFALTGAVILLLLAWANEAVSSKPLREASNISVASSQVATNNLRNAEVIEAMGMLPSLRQRWFKLHKSFLELQAEASEKAATVTSITKFVRLAMQSLVLGLGALLAIEGTITPGMMIGASILMGRALSPVEQIIGIWKQFSSVRSSYERLNALLAVNPPRVAGMSLPAPRGQVTFESVTATPPGTQLMVLRNISFAVSPGDVVGVVGPSASGKSSLARVLVGVWPAVAGKVRLDGADIYQWNKDELGPYIGYLPQDIELFGGSVSENIARFGELDPEKVIAAAKLAGVHDLILRFPNGYDTMLGDGGGGLSGGQKQRIALARALYGDPALVVLDEPNSNLDDVGEKALAAALVQLRQRGASVVVVSHRTNLLSVTNKMLVLIEGTVQAYGPTREVLDALNRTNAPAAPALAGVPQKTTEGVA